MKPRREKTAYAGERRSGPAPPVPIQAYLGDANEANRRVEALERNLLFPWVKARYAGGDCGVSRKLR